MGGTSGVSLGSLRTTSGLLEVRRNRGGFPPVFNGRRFLFRIHYPFRFFLFHILCACARAWHSQRVCALFSSRNEKIETFFFFLIASRARGACGQYPRHGATRR